MRTMGGRPHTRWRRWGRGTLRRSWLACRGTWPDCACPWPKTGELSVVTNHFLDRAPWRYSC